MKTSHHTDRALRKAIGRLVQQQSAPPEGMTVRFMARLAQEKAAPLSEKSTKDSLKNSSKIFLNTPANTSVNTPANTPANTFARASFSTTLVLRYLRVSVAVAAVIVVAFLLWTAAQKSMEQEVVVAVAQHPKTNRNLSHTCLVAEIDSAANDAPEALPVSGCRKSVSVEKNRTLFVENQCDNIENSLPNTEDSATLVAPVAVVSDTHKFVSESLPPDAPEQNIYTAAEKELDRRALEMGGQYDYLIAGEMLALARISLREQFSAISVKNNPSNKPTKPIAL